MNNKTLLDAQGISLQIGQRQILQNISFQIAERQIVTLIGPNGAGKTSLLRIALGLTEPTAGKVNTRTGLRIGSMPQRLHVDQSMPVSVERFL